LDRAALIAELKAFIPEALSLEDEDVDMSDYSEDQHFLTEDLGIDSIDILELTVSLEKKYKIKIGNVETAQEAFQTLGTLADFIISHS
jgi:acyl carrier protein